MAKTYKFEGEAIEQIKPENRIIVATEKVTEDREERFTIAQLGQERKNLQDRLKEIDVKIQEAKKALKIE